MTLRGLSARVLALLLRIWPDDLRESHSGDLAKHFDDLVDLEIGVGRAWAVPLVWFGCLRDALSARFRRRDPTSSNGQRASGRRSSFMSDLRFTLRALVRRPAASLVILGTLGLGIGATSALFSVVKAVLLEPLPFEDQQELVNVWSRNDDRAISRYFLSPTDYLAMRDRVTAVDGLVAFFPNQFTVEDTEARPTIMSGAAVTVGFFSMLGARPLIGRTFLPQDTLPAAGGQIILSHESWMNSFGGDSSVVGTQVPIPGGGSVTMVGVMPPEFRYPNGAAAWGLMLNLRNNVPRDRWLSVVGRLSDEVDIGAATTEFRTAAAAFAREDPELGEGWTYDLEFVEDDLLGETQASLMLLLAATGIILLIACANVANMLLTAAEDRRREIAVRAALGASRMRIAGQMIVENMTLAGLGSMLGLAIAAVGLRGLVRLAPPGIPRLETVGIDSGVLVFSLATTAITGLLFGLAPAVRLLRVDINSVLRDGGRGVTAGRARERLRSTLATVQVAMSVALVIGAALLIRSFAALSLEDQGFEADRVLMFEVTLPAAPGTPYETLDGVSEFYSEFVDRIRDRPGVVGAALASTVPLAESFDYPAPFFRAWLPRPPQGQEDRVYFRQVSDDFFSVIGTDAIQGRTFDAFDTPNGVPVVVVNESFVRRYVSDRNPVGARLGGTQQVFGPLGAMLFDEVEIVGVVPDIRYRGPGTVVEPSIYFPFTQAPFRHMSVLIGVGNGFDPTDVMRVVRSDWESMTTVIPVARVGMLDDLEAEALAPQRFSMTLLVMLGGLAMLLAAVGLYGVLSYNVAQRANEFGVRMAMGAGAVEVARLVLRRAGSMTGAGVVAGLAMAAAGGKLISSQLHGVSQVDFIVYAAVALIVTVVAATASLIPTRRAIRLDPASVLRND